MTTGQGINILYIAGAGRSGSTLLGDVLGLLPGTLHIGELRSVFDYTILPDGIIRCSCGKKYEFCEFWSSIFEALYSQSWPEHFAALRMEGKLPHSKQIPLLILRKRFSKNARLSMQANIDEVIRVLSFMQAKLSLSTIIDTSNAAPFAWFLSQQSNVHLMVVHLVRDPRAVIFSWIRRAIPIYDAEVHQAIVRTRSQVEAVRDWIKANMGAWLLKFYGIPYVRIRYESFARDPAACLRSIVGFARSQGMPLAEDETIMSALIEKRILLGQRHLLGSNPGVKSQTDPVTVKEDTAWISETSHTKRFLWTLIFLPWLIWFGYRVWPRNTQGDKV